MSWKERFARMERAEIAGVSIALAIVLFLALNVTASVAMRADSVDLTQDHLFTVTDTTKRVLSGLREPVTIRLFQSHTLLDSAPRLKLYADRVGQLLTTYQQLSGGKLTVERIDPVAFSPEEDRAIGYGIRGFLVDRSGEQGYFGLVGTNSTDGIEKIEFLDPGRDQSLEYDLTGLVERLAHPDKPKIGIIDGLQMAGSMQLRQQPWLIWQTIGKNYQLENMARPSADFGGIDVLLIAHPHDLPPQTLYAIDQYVLSGKPAAIFIDPVAENSPRDPRMPVMPQAIASDLGPLLAAWGIDWDPTKVVGDPNLAVRVAATAGRQRVIADYLPWIEVDKKNFNHSDVLTSDLQLMRFSSAGALQLAKDATTKFTPLIQTTPQANFLAADDIVTRQQPTVLLDKFKPGNESLVVAGRLTGEAKTAYPDGAPPDPADPHAAPQPAGLKSGTIHLVLVGDTDLLADSDMVGPDGDPVSNNGDFVMNVLDNLAGGLPMNNLRGRGLTVRSFTRVEQMERQSDETYRRTEQKLSQDLDNAQKQLAQLVSQGEQGSGDVQTFSREQQDAIGNFNRQIVDLRRQLRDVRAAGRADIDRLRLHLEVADIGGVPAILVIVGLALFVWRRVRLQHYLRARRGTDGAKV